MNRRLLISRIWFPCFVLMAAIVSIALLPHVWRQAFHDRLVSVVPVGSTVQTFDREAQKLDHHRLCDEVVHYDLSTEVAFVRWYPINNRLIKFKVEALPICDNNVITDYEMTSYGIFLFPLWNGSTHDIIFWEYGDRPDSHP